MVIHMHDMRLQLKLTAGIHKIMLHASTLGKILINLKEIAFFLQEIMAMVSIQLAKMQLDPA